MSQLDPFVNLKQILEENKRLKEENHKLRKQNYEHVIDKMKLESKINEMNVDNWHESEDLKSKVNTLKDDLLTAREDSEQLRSRLCSKKKSYKKCYSFLDVFKTNCTCGAKEKYNTRKRKLKSDSEKRKKHAK